MTTATCCDAARDNEALRWADPDDFYGTGDKLKFSGEPIGWYWAAEVIFEGTTGTHDVHVTRCPFCGAELPVLGPTDMPAERREDMERARDEAWKASAEKWERDRAAGVPLASLSDALAVASGMRDALVHHMAGE